MRANFAHFYVLLIAVLLGACGSPEDRAAGYMEKAQEFFEAEDYERARLEAKNAAQIDPKNPQTRYLLAMLDEKDGKWQGMVGNLLVAVDEDPNYIDARVKLGNLYFIGQAYDEASEQSEKLLELAPDDPRTLLLAARLDFVNENIDSARERVNKALAAEPENVEGILLNAAIQGANDTKQGLAVIDEAIGRIDDRADKKILRELRVSLYENQERYLEAENEYQALIADYPDETSYQTRLAAFYARRGRVEDAESILREVIDTSIEDKVGGQLTLVQFLGQARNPEAAREALKGFVADSPESARLRFALGRLHETLGDSDEAFEAYTAAAELDPKSAEGLAARNRLIALELRNGNEEKARTMLDGVLADEPDNASALLVQAGLKIQAREYDDAIADLRIVLRKNPASSTALLTLARTYRQKQDPVLAADTYRRLLELQPTHKAATLELAEVHIISGEGAAAETVLRTRLNEVPDDAEIQNRLIDALMAQEKYAAARNAAQRLEELVPDLGVANYQAGRAWLAEAKFQQATDSFRSALQAAPKSEPALRGLLEAMVRNSQQDQALEFLQNHINEQPDFIAGRLLLANLLAGSGDRDGAIAELRTVVEMEPKLVRPYIGLGALYAEDSEKRLSAFRDGLKALPGNEQLTLLLGSELERQGRIDDAIQVYSDAVEVNPESQLATNNLAALLLDYRDDAQSWTRALDVAKGLSRATNPVMVDTLGWAYYKNGDFQQAVQLLETAVAKADNIPVLHYHLGMAYKATKNDVGARRELEKALAADDVNFIGVDEAKKTLESLRSKS